MGSPEQRGFKQLDGPSRIVVAAAAGEQRNGRGRPYSQMGTTEETVVVVTICRTVIDPGL
jgi:hypothetical protein